MLDEPVHLVTRARPSAEGNHAGGHAGGQQFADLGRYAGRRWIAGCDRCRVHLITQCSLAGFSPKIAFTTDDYVAVQALVAAGLGVATLPDLALRAARHPAIRTAELPGARRHVFALRYGEPPDSPATIRLIDALCAAAATLATVPARAGRDGPRGAARGRRCGSGRRSRRGRRPAAGRGGRGAGAAVRRGAAAGYAAAAARSCRQLAGSHAATAGAAPRAWAGDRHSAPAAWTATR